jgi:predicted ferric reductase
VGVGQLAFYLMLVVYGSFYVRRHLGQRGWRLLHYTTFLALVGATVHGLMSGTDTSASWAMWSYAGASIAVVFLLGYRIALAVFGGTRREPVPVMERIARSESS